MALGLRARAGLRCGKQQSPLSRKFCSFSPGSQRCGHLLLRDKLPAGIRPFRSSPEQSGHGKIQGPVPSPGLALAPERGLWTRTMLEVWRALAKSGLTSRPSVCFRTPEPGTQSKGQEPAQGQERPPGLCSLLPRLLLRVCGWGWGSLYSPKALSQAWLV